MAEDTNYSSEQNDGISPDININIVYQWWCEKCLNYHTGLYSCPYENLNYCPHCGQLMRIRK